MGNKIGEDEMNETHLKILVEFLIQHADNQEDNIDNSMAFLIKILEDIDPFPWYYKLKAINYYLSIRTG